MRCEETILENTKSLKNKMKKCGWIQRSGEPGFNRGEFRLSETQDKHWILYFMNIPISDGQTPREAFDNLISKLENISPGC